MNASVLPMYLLGSRRAILEVARTPSAVLCGILFTVSAGLAREYDGEDLLHEPWQVLRPLAASLLSGTLLFVIVHGAALARRDRSAAAPPRFLDAYRSFMGLFWMTAPLAWLYALPYERFLEPAGAVAANLWTLAIVATWRVLLISRAVGVTYVLRPVPAFFLVMLFADAVVFAAVSLVPTPIIDVMGGIRHSPEDALLSEVAFSVSVLSVLSAPVWLVGALAGLRWLRPTWAAWREPLSTSGSRGMLVMAAASILAWAPALAWCQPEQIHSRQVERLLCGGEVAAALLAMSARGRTDFPPHWDPPPRLGYRYAEPDLAEIRAAMRAQWPAEWVAEIYLAKMRRQLEEALLLFRRGPADWPALIQQAEDHDYVIGQAHEQADAIMFLVEFDRTFTGDDLAALRRLSELRAAQ